MLRFSGEETMETYREQLARLVRTMTTANREADVVGDLAGASSAAQVKIFVEGNLEKRLDKLQVQLSFVADAFEDFDELLIAYMRVNPPVAYDSALSDGERMLAWLVDSSEVELSPVQRDYLACQRARHAVERKAELQRAKHVHFQDLRSLAEAALSQLAVGADLRVYLNPIRAWGRFETAALLDDQSDRLPCDVLFFADGEEIASAVFELEGQALLNQLADNEPCTLDEWNRISYLAEREELTELCRDFSQMGLIAFG